MCLFAIILVSVIVFWCACVLLSDIIFVCLYTVWLYSFHTLCCCLLKLLVWDCLGKFAFMFGLSVPNCVYKKRNKYHNLTRVISRFSKDD